MKNILFIVIGTLLSLNNIFAQEDFTLIGFNSGNFDVIVSFNSSVFSGLNNDITGFGDNPARYTFQKKPSVSASFFPPIRLNITGITKAQSEAKIQFEELAKNFDESFEDLSDPNVDVKLHQLGGIYSTSVVFPYNETFTIGLSTYQLLDFRINLIGTATQIRLKETNPDQNLDTTRILFNADGFLDFQHNIQTWDLSIGAKISKKFSLGLTIQRYRSWAKINGKFELGGIMRVLGEEFYFNDPKATNLFQGQKNDLNQFIVGEYEGNGFGFRLGGIYKLNNNFFVSGMVTLIPSFEIDGDSLQFIQNRPLFIIGDPLDDPEEVSDLLVKDLIDPQVPTLTRRVENPSADKMTTRLPSSLSLALLHYGKSLDFGANLTIYFSELSYSYLQYTRGFKPSTEFQFMLNFMSPWYIEPENLIVRTFGSKKRMNGKWQIKLGFSLLKEIREGYTDDDEFDPSNGPFPLFTLARSTRLSRHLQLNVTLLGTPATFVKSTLVYQF